MDVLKADPELLPLVENQDLSVWIGHKRHVMSYPINGGKTYNLVLSHPDATSPDTWATDQETILAEMKNNYRGWDPK